MKRADETLAEIDKWLKTEKKNYGKGGKKTCVNG